LTGSRLDEGAVLASRSSRKQEMRQSRGDNLLSRKNVIFRVLRKHQAKNSQWTYTMGCARAEVTNMRPAKEFRAAREEFRRD